MNTTPDQADIVEVMAAAYHAAWQHFPASIDASNVDLVRIDAMRAALASLAAAGFVVVPIPSLRYKRPTTGEAGQ